MILNLVSDQSWGNIKQNEPTVNFKAWDEPNEKKHIHIKWAYMGIKIRKDFQTSQVAFHSGNSRSQNISIIYNEFWKVKTNVV